MEFVREAFEEVRVCTRKLGVRSVGPPFVIRTDDLAGGLVDLEVGYQVDRIYEGAGRVHGGRVPPILLSDS